MLIILCSIAIPNVVTYVTIARLAGCCGFLPVGWCLISPPRVSASRSARKVASLEMQPVVE